MEPMRGRRRRSARVNEVRGRTSRRRLHSRLSRAMNDSDGTVRAEGSEFINTKWHLLLSLLFYFGFFFVWTVGGSCDQDWHRGSTNFRWACTATTTARWSSHDRETNERGTSGNSSGNKVNKAHTHTDTHTDTHTHTHTHQQANGAGRQQISSRRDPSWEASRVHMRLLAACKWKGAALALCNHIGKVPGVSSALDARRPSSLRFYAPVHKITGNKS